MPCNHTLLTGAESSRGGRAILPLPIPPPNSSPNTDLTSTRASRGTQVSNQFRPNNSPCHSPGPRSPCDSVGGCCRYSSRYDHHHACRVEYCWARRCSFRVFAAPDDLPATAASSAAIRTRISASSCSSRAWVCCCRSSHHLQGGRKLRRRNRPRQNLLLYRRAVSIPFRLSVSWLASL